MKFYEIESEYLALAGALDTAETPEDYAAIEARFGCLDGALAEKVSRTLPLILTLDAEAAATKAEASRLASLADARARKAKVLRDLVFRTMQAAGLDKVATPIGAVAIQANGGQRAIVYAPEFKVDDLAPEYVRVVPEIRVPDAEAVRAALAADEVLPGVTLAPRGTHLRIK